MKTLKGYKQIRNIGKFIPLVFLNMCMISSNINAQISEKNDDKTLSPYFFVQSSESGTEQLPLKSTRADVNIAGIIADVKVTQEYKNEGNGAIEAIYIFPASTRAAVYKMTMTIGERTINAVIKERNQARQEYEEAKQQGKSASLLEQQRPNVFQMNVANIMPGDLVKVELCYTELLVPENGIYEFVYPTVVGPRYSNKTEETASENDKWVANPYTQEGEKPMYTFDIKVNLLAGMPLNDVRCTTHETDIAYTSKDKATITLKPGSNFEGNRDYILQYRLKGSAIQQGLLMYKGKDENFFLAMIQPPKRIVPEQIPPREYVFIVDVSGSMHGFPLNISKEVLRDLIGKLRPSDRFNVILFAGASNLMAEQSVAATQDNISKAIKFIDAQQGGGGTELLPALKRALALKGTEEFSRTFIILTDGYVAVEKESFDLVRKSLGNANFFAFGIGSSVNRFLIEGFAHVGAGESFVVENPDKAKAMAQKFRKYIESPVLTNITIKYDGLQVYDIEPMSVPDMFAERPVIIFGKWRGNAQGRIVLSGKTGNENYCEELDIKASDVSVNNSALRYLWARKRIQLLDDYSKADNSDNTNAKQVTDLGLKYNLLTAYTSFIAVDSEVRNTTGQTTTIKQPLPLPQGVSNYAVGGYAMKSTAAPTNYYRKTLRADACLEIAACEAIPDSFAFTETEPQFQGGDLSKFKAYIQKNFVYPASLKNSGIKGRVIVQFNVDETGKVVDIKIIRGLDPAIDKEIIRAMKGSPVWTPGTRGGSPAKIKMTLPLDIKE
jgi:Ca-activated chloride channel family protein